MKVERRSRQQIEATLAESKLAGPNLAHSRSNNLNNVHRLVRGDSGVTLGIDLIHQQLRRDSLTPEQVLDLIANITGCSKDITREEGQGYISPAAVYEGLRRAAAALQEAIAQQCSFLFATGHPKNMLEAYQQLAGYVRSKGCEVIAQPPRGIEYNSLKLEIRGSVYVVTYGGEPVHTHNHEHMRELLTQAPPVGIAVADHGFAGAALNLGIPTVCVMDTNDPGVAVAAALGAPVTVVPLNDNSPGDIVRAIGGIIEEFIETAEGTER